jgi:hypothetical protein
VAPLRKLVLCSDLALAGILTALHVGLVLGGVDGALRVMTGFLFVVLLPGYAIVSVLYGERFNELERLGVGIAVSLAVFVLGGLGMNSIGLPVTGIWNACVFGAVTVVFCCWGCASRIRSAGQLSRPLLRLSGVLVFACCGAGLGALQSAQRQVGAAPVVALSLERPGGSGVGYDVAVHAGQQVSVVVNLSYRGAGEQTFRLLRPSGAGLHVRTGTQGGFPRAAATTTVRVHSGHVWTERDKVRMMRPGWYKLTWSVRPIADLSASRSVHLWIQVS